MIRDSVFLITVIDLFIVSLVLITGFSIIRKISHPA
jgi:hypothetical protein